MPADPQPPADTLVYANWARLDANPYDVSLEFGYRMGEAPPKEPAVHLVLTWEYAKDILLLLGNAVEQYEKQAGPIRDFESTITPAVRPKQPQAQRRKRK
jgi:hypothetical protein